MSTQTTTTTRPARRYVAPRYSGIAVARALAQGDVSTARLLVGQRMSWRVCELRAILGAGAHIERAYGAPAGIARSVLGWPPLEAPGAPQARPAVRISKAARREIDRKAKCGGVYCRRRYCPICG